MVDKKRRSLFKKIPNYNQQPLPWLKKPANFIHDCTQCQKCLPVCETRIIVLGDGGFPHVDFQKDECSFCYACANVCPENLFLPENEPPWQQKAVINDGCLAKHKVECRSCSDSCEPRAINFTLKIRSVAEPSVNTEACNGCGACISSCPVMAISIQS